MEPNIIINEEIYQIFKSKSKSNPKTEKRKKMIMRRNLTITIKTLTNIEEGDPNSITNNSEIIVQNHIQL